MAEHGMHEDDYSWVDSPLEKKAQTPKPKQTRKKVSRQLRMRYRNYANKAAADGRPVIPFDRWVSIHGD